MLDKFAAACTDTPIASARKNAGDWNDCPLTAAVSRMGTSAAVNVCGRIASAYSLSVAAHRGDVDDVVDDVGGGGDGITMAAGRATSDDTTNWTTRQQVNLLDPPQVHIRALLAKGEPYQPY